jgi:DNA topoisomerase-1
LFRGRGEHPKTGCLKERTLAESISLNVSEDAPVPKCSLPGHAWQSVRHDPAVTWLCSWNENVQGQTKYVMLSASSSFKGKSDQDKYLTAIQLKSCIGKVRRDYEEKIKSSVRHRYSWDRNSFTVLVLGSSRQTAWDSYVGDR